MNLLNVKVQLKSNLKKVPTLKDINYIYHISELTLHRIIKNQTPNPKSQQNIYKTQWQTNKATQNQSKTQKFNQTTNLKT